MKKYKVLLCASVREKRIKLFSVFIMIFIAVLCMGTGITILRSGNQTIENEMNRLGYGDFTIWIHGDSDNLKKQIESVSGVDSVKSQSLIYAGYQINGSYSDNEGQILNLNKDVLYDFILENGNKTIVNEIEPGSIYVSPALKSIYDFNVGDVIIFDLARSNGKKEFKIAGFFADGFMGSSMIDMKSFLICEEDFVNLQNILGEVTASDRLGKAGAMLHITGDSIDGVSSQELLRRINENTTVSLQTEFSYQKESIKSYMLLLQNILCGFLIAFSVVLLLIAIIVVGKSIRDDIDEEKKDIAILKCMGLSSLGLKNIYNFLYLNSIILGSLIGVALVNSLAHLLSDGMVTSTGMKVQVNISIMDMILIIVGIIFVFFCYIAFQMNKMLQITPIEVIRTNEKVNRKSKSRIKGKHLAFTMALREITTKKKAYVGIFIISVMLVLFLSIVGKMGNWLGPNGEGLMDAFSVADHDIGVQPYSNEVPMDEIERVINWYSPIKEKYELAMQDVNIEGLPVTANILNDTSFFHVLKGKVCEGNEILITETVADELNIGIGDMVTVTGTGRQEEYQISGIYQCANGMGSNIGMNLSGYSHIGNTSGYIWCYHYILEDGMVRDYVMDYLQEHYESIDVHTNSWSGLNGIVKMMKAVMIVIYIIAALFVLITVKLTAENLLRLESSNMAIYKSMGMKNNMIQKAFILRFLIVVMTGFDSCIIYR